MVLLSCLGMMAQSTFDVSGTVVEKATGEAVMAATIQLMTLPDSTFVEGTTTGAQGEFSLKNVKKGTYALQVSYIGYATKNISVDLTQQKKKTVNIGYITMSADAIALEGVEVKGHATKVAVSGDSLVYNAAAYRVPEGSTLEALVKQLPGVKVDKDGTIKINGKEFFLNDKEVAMKNIPTDMIDKLKTYERKSDRSRVTGIDDGGLRRTPTGAFAPRRLLAPLRRQAIRQQAKSASDTDVKIYESGWHLRWGVGPLFVSVSPAIFPVSPTFFFYFARTGRKFAPSTINVNAYDYEENSLTDYHDGIGVCHHESTEYIQRKWKCGGKRIG